MDHIGPYRLLKLIRAGGTTHVWEAMDPVEHQRVALKSLQPDYRNDKTEIASLRHEFAVGRTLHHPNVNSVRDFNIVRGIPFVVMDYFNAPNLKQSIRQNPEQIKENLESIVRQMAAGLDHLHEQGWLHRDIKPDNYLIGDQSDVRLIDFAICQKIKKKSALGALFGGKTKNIMGTRSYMSPEQIRGEHLDPYSDIYSLACVIFELCCGRAPFTGSTADELLTKHLRSAPPSIASINRDISPEFSRLVVSMMAKDPAQRPQSISEFLEQLDKIRMFTAAKRV